MKLSKAEQQGLRLAVSLARLGGQVGLADLADREQLSSALVAKIIGKLRKSGVVRAVRGRFGGYRLAAAPIDITVATVLRALGPNRILQGCFDSDGTSCVSVCPHDEDCGLRVVMAHLERQMTEVLEQVTLADLARDEGHMRRRLADFCAPVSTL